MQKNPESQKKAIAVQIKTEDETVKIGHKPAIHYILAAMTLFSQGAKTVTLKARGQSIATAVSVEEAVRRRMGNQEPIVKLGTEEVKDKKGERMLKVSTIDIILKSTLC